MVPLFGFCRNTRHGIKQVTETREIALVAPVSAHGRLKTVLRDALIRNGHLAATPVARGANFMSSEPRSNVPEITLVMVRESLGSAVLCDALDALGFRHQSPSVALRPMTTTGVLVGRCRTMLWSDMAHADPSPYELELAAVDDCRQGDVLIAAAGGSASRGSGESCCQRPPATPGAWARSSTAQCETFARCAPWGSRYSPGSPVPTIARIVSV